MQGIDSFLKRVMDIPGAISATLIDGANGLLIQSAGRHPCVDAQTDAAMSTDIVRAIAESPVFSTGEPHLQHDIIVSRPGAYHLLCPVVDDYAARLFLHVAFDDSIGNIALSRYTLRAILAASTWN